MCNYIALKLPNTIYIYIYIYSPDTLLGTLASTWLDPVCLQNCINSSWHRFNEVLETFLRDFGSYCHDSIKSNQIKSLLLSHHHSTSALVSEILMSVLQTVQKNNKQFTYGQTVQKTTTTKKQTLYIWTDSAKKLHWSIYSAPDSAKKQQQQFTYGQTVQKSNSNLHMDSTYLQTVQKTMCKIHIHILSTHSVLQRHT